MIGDEIKKIDAGLKKILVQAIHADVAGEVQKALMQARTAAQEALAAWEKYYPE